MRFLPKVTRLEQNYPNPFNPVTTINFDLAKEDNVKISIYNYAGKLVSTLVNNSMKAGNYSLKFDGKALSSGVYFYQMETSGFRKVKKMVLAK